MIDIMQLDPRLLLALTTIYEERNVSRAADKLGMTQQGLSGALARLRGVFADRLFVRESHGVAPTPQADEIYPRALKAIQALQRVLEVSAFDPASAKRSVKFAVADYALATAVLPLIRRLECLAPGLDFLVDQFRGDLDVLEARRGDVDFVFTVREFAPQAARSIMLFSDRYVLAMRSGHPLAGQAISLDQFCEAEHVLVSPNRSLAHGVTDIALEKLGRSRRIRVVLPGFALAPKLLSETDFVAVLPERLVDDHPSLLTKCRPPIDLKPFDLIAVWPERLQDDALHLWLREMLRIYVGDQ